MAKTLAEGIYTHKNLGVNKIIINDHCVSLQKISCNESGVYVVYEGRIINVLKEHLIKEK